MAPSADPPTVSLSLPSISSAIGDVLCRWDTHRKERLLYKIEISNRVVASRKPGSVHASAQETVLA